MMKNSSNLRVAENDVKKSKFFCEIVADSSWFKKDMFKDWLNIFELTAVIRRINFEAKVILKRIDNGNIEHNRVTSKSFEIRTI